MILKIGLLCPSDPHLKEKGSLRQSKIDPYKASLRPPKKHRHQYVSRIQHDTAHGHVMFQKVGRNAYGAHVVVGKYLFC